MGVDYCAGVWDPVADTLTVHIGPVGGVLSTHTAPLDGKLLSAVDLQSLYLGSAVQFPDPDFQGRIREFRIWNGALSGTEVAASFAAGMDAPPGDSDGDGLPDAWEFSFAGITHLDQLDGGGDFDADGLSDADEHLVTGTDPTDADSDNDSFSDLTEHLLGSDPNAAGDLPVAPTPTLAHRYSFTSDASDSIGTADLSLVGNASIAGGSLNLPGGAARTHHAAAEGAALAELAGTLNGNVLMTVEAWFNQDAALDWAKLFMAGRDSGFNFIDITPRRLVDGNVSSLSINNGSPEANAISATPLANHTDYYLAATWNGLTDQLELHIGPVGGTLQKFTAPMGGNTLAVQEWYLGSAVQFDDPDFDGQIDEFRIWNGALDDGRVALHFALGPDELTAAPRVTATSIDGGLFSMALDGLTPGQVYHVESSESLDTFTPVSGSEFTAAGLEETLELPTGPIRRFFRLVEGPIPP